MTRYVVRRDQVSLTDDRPYQVRGWKVPVLENRQGYVILAAK